MTPEQLSEYLLKRRFSEDAVQYTILVYLTSRCPIRFPKAWGWKTATHFQNRQGALSQRFFPLDFSLHDPSASPLRVAEVREALAQAFANPPPRKRGRPRGGIAGQREDYEALLRERR